MIMPNLEEKKMMVKTVNTTYTSNAGLLTLTPPIPPVISSSLTGLNIMQSTERISDVTWHVSSKSLFSTCKSEQ
jgi:hypothetical protein